VAAAATSSALPNSITRCSFRRPWRCYANGVVWSLYYRKLLVSIACSYTVTARRLLSRKASAAESLVYFGTYTNKRKSKGLYVSHFNSSTGKAQDPIIAAEIKSPSWVVMDPGGRFLYAVTEEGRIGSVSAFSIDRATGKLTALNTVSTKGNGRCHLAVDHTGKTLLAGLQDTEPTL
jgi:hypothetical protein